MLKQMKFVMAIRYQHYVIFNSRFSFSLVFHSFGLLFDVPVSCSFKFSFRAIKIDEEKFFP